jgi:hypothetical protein
VQARCPSQLRASRRYAFQYQWGDLRLHAGLSVSRRWQEDLVLVKRKWLKVFALAMMGMASGFAPVNPKELAEMMHLLSERKIEFSIPDDSGDGDGDSDTDRWWKKIDSVEIAKPRVVESDNASRE